MKRLFKTAMLWLLVLALPVQGFAAVMQSSCTPTRQGVVAVSGLLQDAAHSHHQGAAEHQHQITDSHAEHAMHGDAAAATDDQTNTHTNVKCSACAAGCMGVAILSAMPEIPAFPVASIPVLSSLSSWFPAHIPDALKRPPKFFLV